MADKIGLKATGLACHISERLRQMAVLMQVTEEPNGRKAKSASSANMASSSDRQDHSLQPRVSFALLLEEK